MDGWSHLTGKYITVECLLSPYLYLHIFGILGILDILKVPCDLYLQIKFLPIEKLMAPKNPW